MKIESKFRSELIKEIEKLFEGCLITHFDPQDIQGMPDLLILYRKNWAALETKRYDKASRRPNQEYYVKLLNDMSYASFVCPENKEEVLYELYKAFGVNRPTRVLRR